MPPLTRQGGTDVWYRTCARVIPFCREGSDELWTKTAASPAPERRDTTVRPVTGHIWDEDGIAYRTPKRKPLRPKWWEGTLLEQREVAVADVSGLTHFLDGVQRTKIV